MHPERSLYGVGCCGRAEVTGLCTLAPSSPEEAESREDGRLGSVPL